MIYVLVWIKKYGHLCFVSVLTFRLRFVMNMYTYMFNKCVSPASRTISKKDWGRARLETLSKPFQISNSMKLLLMMLCFKRRQEQIKISSSHLAAVNHWERRLYLLWLRGRLRRGRRLLRLHFGHQWEGRQARGRPPRGCGDHADDSAPSHGLSDGALRLRGRGLLGVETLGVTAWRWDLEMRRFKVKRDLFTFMQI